jgi:hypothetical protein
MDRTMKITGLKAENFVLCFMFPATLTWSCSIFLKHILEHVYASNLILLVATLPQAQLMPWSPCGMLMSWLAYVLSPGK